MINKLNQLFGRFFPEPFGVLTERRDFRAHQLRNHNAVIPDHGNVFRDTKPFFQYRADTAGTTFLYNFKKTIRHLQYIYSHLYYPY